MVDKAIILVLSAHHPDLETLTRRLDKEGYDTVSATSLGEFDQVVKGKSRIALSLLDVSGFDQHIWERCDMLRKAKVPFIIISPQFSPAIQRRGAEHGASALFIRPISVTDMIDSMHALVNSPQSHRFRFRTN